MRIYRRPAITTGSFEHHFGSLQPYKGFTLYVDGSCDVEYLIDRDDPDVGYHGGIQINVTRISINSEEKDKGALNLDSKLELYSLIEDALNDSFNLEAEILDHAHAQYDED